MTLLEFNNSHRKHELFKTTCGAESWVNQMIKSSPFVSKQQLLETGERLWFDTQKSDWMEAFLHHPEIGNIDTLREKYGQGKNLSETEQSDIGRATEETLLELSTQNKAYKDRFGFIFIVFATGKSANQMLGLLNDRINNTKEQEMQTAMIEQWKITRLRINNLLT